ncbi:MAG: MFS transporter, partial [Raoultibacter sp.]
MKETASAIPGQVVAAQQKQAAVGAEKFYLIPVLVLMLAQIGTVGENGAMSIAASQLTTQLGATMGDIQLANMIYPLIAGAVMVVGGMLGTIIGWEKNLRIGLILAAAGEIIAAFSPNIAVFIWGGRVLTGLGGSLLVPSLLGLVPTIYKSGKNRALAFGCIGAAMGIANVMPLVLGALMDTAGFRMTFGVLGAYFLVVFATSFTIPKTDQVGSKLKFDTKGTILAVIGLFMFLFGVSRISVWGLTTASAAAPFSIMGISPAPILAVLGLIVLVILFKVEKTVEDKNGCALIPRSFYQTPQVLAGLVTCAAIFIFNGAMVMLCLPYAQLVAGWSALLSGIMMIAYGIPMFIFALGQPKLFPNVSPRRVVQLGYILAAIATVVIALSFTVEGVNFLI